MRVLTRGATGLAGFLFAMATPALAQTAMVSGQVVLADGGQALGYTTVSIVSETRQLLTNESGRFMLPNVAPGEMRLRFKRIGYAPKDTTLRLAANDTVTLRIALRRLVIQLPEMLVSGKCTNETPLAEKPAVMAELFDQVNQNAERVKLLAKQQPFVLFVYRLRGFRNPPNKVIATTVDTVIRQPLPVSPYEPKKVLRVAGYASLELALPELSDIASTEFTSNHCMTYAGKTLWGSDSVVQVDFEPTPKLSRDPDVKGSVYLKADGYQLVGSVTKLTRIPPSLKRGGLEDVTVSAKFTELVPGIPVLDEWEFVSGYGKRRSPGIERGQVFNIKWLDSTGKMIESAPPQDDKPVRTLVQRFYDMYGMLRGSQGSLGAQEMMVAAIPAFLDDTIAKLLRDDVAARRAQPSTRDTLSADPFLGMPVACPRYRVEEIRMRGDSATAFVHSICPAAGADSVSKAPVSELSLVRRGGSWEIIDFSGPDGPLKSVLCKNALADRDPARRPKSCPSS
jgi:hypothetical protein